MPPDPVGSSRKRQRIAPSTRPTYPRKRATQACHTCRQKRIKCDNEHPACGSCTNLGVQCIYRENDNSTFDPASIAILQRLETLEELFRAAHPAVSETQTATVAEPPSIVGPLNNLDSPALERKEPGAPYHINVETILGWSVFQNRGLKQTKSLRSLLKPQSSDLEPPPRLLDFENSSARELFRKFLEHVHAYNPVLEVEKIEQYIRDTLYDGIAWDARSCLLLLIFALGTISGSSDSTHSETSSDFRYSEEFSKAEEYFSAAQKRLGSLLCKNGVIEAQAFFYAGVYLMATLRPFEAWRMFVQALACCETFDSHQPDAERGPEKDNIRRTIYWTCFKSELELRLELNVGRSCVLDLTYPAFFPSPPIGLKSEEEAVWYFYLAEIALRRLGNRILNHLYDQNQRGNASDVEAILNFEDQATGWLSSLPALLSLGDLWNPGSADTEDTDSHSALRFILTGHLIDCYEMMYWPFVVDAIHNTTLTTTPDFQAHHKNFARKGFDLCMLRILQNSPGFFDRHHGTWLMLRSCTRSALVLIAGVLMGLEELLPPDWEGGVGKVLGLLRYWKDEAADVADKLEILEWFMDNSSERPWNVV
ncbi:hypothetical protein BJY04DRAFT_218569 [Aspergillus karnatakaensis]|uniref:uncharacterized protein n=1 Tax=Aspergillus karnatakaensis TaxID=1810916 RepID=UPI003CCD7390